MTYFLLRNLTASQCNILKDAWRVGLLFPLIGFTKVMQSFLPFSFFLFYSLLFLSPLHSPSLSPSLSSLCSFSPSLYCIDIWNAVGMYFENINKWEDHVRSKTSCIHLFLLIFSFIIELYSIKIIWLFKTDLHSSVKYISDEADLEVSQDEGFWAIEKQKSEILGTLPGLRSKWPRVPGAAGTQNRVTH